ncbi:MAG: hypothetical protein AAB738_03455 [Patescibacteria group bacterium]
MLEKFKWQKRKGNAAVFFVLIIGFALLVFLVSSGALKRFGVEKIDFSSLNSFRKSTSSIVQKSTSSSAIKPVPKKQEPTAAPIIKPKPAPTSTINPSQIPAGFTLEQLSPYFKKIRIGSVSPGSSRSYGVVNLTANLKESEAVDVTGWVLKGKSGSQFIPQAVEVYGPLGLTSPGDIVLKKGHILSIHSSKSIIGQNLRLNKCTGYLESLFDFIPALPRDCPKTYSDRSELYEFSGQCEDYVRSLGTCKIPEMNFLWLTSDSKCRDFLDKVNYRGCFDKHRQDGDFLSYEWRVWTGSRFLDERHDRVFIFDKNGLLVDERSY